MNKFKPIPIDNITVSKSKVKEWKMTENEYLTIINKQLKNKLCFLIDESKTKAEKMGLIDLPFYYSDEELQKIDIIDHFHIQDGQVWKGGF